ncbi:hypothetical protein ACIQXI_10710 [Lysinibacillus sp. NPDC097195]|uniref:hypothetical protein n=1 Tax=Lysinibacillus sp. NPDC097195 TaxID=3364141 RepID=UPI00382089A5
MDNYYYENLLDDLRVGREIHFLYMSESYYIGRGTGQFMFWRFYDAASQIIGKDMDDLLQQVKLGGLPIKEVWESIVIKEIF